MKIIILLVLFRAAWRKQRRKLNNFVRAEARTVCDRECNTTGLGDDSVDADKRRDRYNVAIIPGLDTRNGQKDEHGDDGGKTR